MDDFLKKVLPWIGAAATGGVPALVTMAASAVSGAIGADVPANAESLSKAISEATPDQILALKNAENDFAAKMQAMGFAHIEEMAKIGLQETQTFVGDVADARAKHYQNTQVFWLGVAVLTTFAVIMVLSLVGAYLILSGGLTIKDVGIVAAVFTFLGSILGYVAAMAQQVSGFYWGSSKGSRDNADAMAMAFKQLGDTKQ